MQTLLDFSEERPILSVSQLVHQLRFELERRFQSLWVRGEISNFKRYPSGHCYFTLKDRDAQLSAVCFRMQAQLLKFDPEDGMDVQARGSISVYPARGQLQMVVEHLEPVGQGALQLAFERLKQKLHAQGLFDPAKKKKLPLLPYKVGVVTSPSGAAIQDILRVLARRNDRLNVLIFPARVQGPGAAREVVRGLDYLAKREDVDVIIVARGGGSLEDLWAFIEEGVARAIFRSPKPVISAVGHEVDFTIADFAADIRAATPSAAAEMVSVAREELQARVDGLNARSSQALRLLLQSKRHNLQKLAGSRAFVDAESRIKMFSQRLDELQSRLAAVLPSKLPQVSRQVVRLRDELIRQWVYSVAQRRQYLAGLSDRLQAYSPLAVLDRGYAIVTDQKNEIVRHPEQVPEGGWVDIRVTGGPFRARKGSGEEE